jgi:hypothetical protein
MAIVNVQDIRDCLHKCRCLLDSALRVSFIIDAVINIVGMRRTKNYIPLKGINNVASDDIVSTYSFALGVASLRQSNVLYLT